MTPHRELDQDRAANTQEGQPIGGEDLHATVSDGAGAPEEARTIPDPDNGQKAAFLHRRVSPLPHAQQSESTDRLAEEGKTATPAEEVTANAVETELRPSVWEATGLGQRSYEDKDAPESDLED